MKVVILSLSSDLAGLVPADLTPHPLPPSLFSLPPAEASSLFLLACTFPLDLCPWSSLFLELSFLWYSPSTGHHFSKVFTEMPPISESTLMPPQPLTLPRPLASFIKLTAPITLTCNACVCRLVFYSFSSHQNKNATSVGLLQFSS